MTAAVMSPEEQLVEDIASFTYDPLGYAYLILNGDSKEYLKNAAGSHGIED